MPTKPQHGDELTKLTKLKKLTKLTNLCQLIKMITEPSDPVPGVSTQIGYYLAALEYTRAQLQEGVSELSNEQIAAKLCLKLVRSDSF